MRPRFGQAALASRALMTVVRRCPCGIRTTTAEMPAREVRVVATDIDGTVFDAHHEVPASNAAAMRAAKEQGVHVVVCTGKVAGPWSTYMLSALRLGSYSVYNNGGLILDPAGKTVYESVIPPEVVLDVFAALGTLDGATSQVAISCQGLSYKYALFAKERNDVSNFIASAGENPPEIVPGGDLSGFVEANGLTVNKLFLATDSLNGGADFDAMLAAIEAAAAGRAEMSVIHECSSVPP